MTITTVRFHHPKEETQVVGQQLLLPPMIYTMLLLVFMLLVAVQHLCSSLFIPLLPLLLLTPTLNPLVCPPLFSSKINIFLFFSFLVTEMSSMKCWVTFFFFFMDYEQEEEAWRHQWGFLSQTHSGKSSRDKPWFTSTWWLLFLFLLISSSPSPPETSLPPLLTLPVNEISSPILSLIFLEFYCTIALLVNKMVSNSSFFFFCGVSGRGWVQAEILERAGSGAGEVQENGRQEMAVLERCGAGSEVLRAPHAQRPSPFKKACGT